MKWFKYWDMNDAKPMYQVDDTVQDHYKEFLKDTPEEAWKTLCGVTSNGKYKLVAVNQDLKVIVNTPTLKDAIRAHKMNQL